MMSLLRMGAILGKEVRQLSRDRLTAGMIVGIPLMQILLFGYAINLDVRHLRAGVADQAVSTWCLLRCSRADLEIERARVELPIVKALVDTRCSDLAVADCKLIRGDTPPDRRKPEQQPPCPGAGLTQGRAAGLDGH